MTEATEHALTRAYIYVYKIAQTSVYGKKNEKHSGFDSEFIVGD